MLEVPSTNVRCYSRWKRHFQNIEAFETAVGRSVGTGGVVFDDMYSRGIAPSAGRSFRSTSRRLPLLTKQRDTTG